MIKKLKRKFIIISALSVFLVLLLTIGIINLSNYIVTENEAKTTLVEILNQGPKQNFEPGGPREGEPFNLRQVHYFIVSFNSDGSIKESDNRQMFILSQEEATSLATKVYNNELVGGKYNNFRYSKITKEDNVTYVAFVDIKESLDNLNNFLVVSSLISIGAYLVFIGLIILASKTAFKSTEEAYKKQKRFITNASHELKTPLTVISADLDLIEMDKGQDEWSESIRDQISRLTKMTNNLVTLSRLEEEDNTRYPLSTFSLSDTSEEIASSFINAFKKENIEFKYRIEENIQIKANKDLIDELIHIFLENSLKYTSGDNKISEFKLFKNKNKVELVFSNSIDELDEIDTKQVMERFYRSPSNKKEGSGIGLSIASEIISLHKGKININKTNKEIDFQIIFTLN